MNGWTVLFQTLTLCWETLWPEKVNSRSSPLITSRGPKKVLFRPLDHDNMRLWMRQVEDVFETMCITSQLNKFTTLTTLLSADEATVIQDLTLAQPRPDDVFEHAKLLLFTRYDRPIRERPTRVVYHDGWIWGGRNSITITPSRVCNSESEVFMFLVTKSRWL